MKLAPTLLALSLAANAALAWLWWSDAPARVLPEPIAATKSSAPTAARPAPAESNVAAAAVASTPKVALSPAALRDRLRALGFPEDVVRSVVRATIEEARRALRRQFYAEAAKRPWWRGPQSFLPEQERQLRAALKAENDEILRVLGPLGLVADEQLERYSYLPPEKAAQLATLELNYAELRRDLADSAAAGNAEAREHQKLVAGEHDRDLAALLTPEERAAFDERESTSARSISYRLEYFNATDTEYRALVALQKDFNERMGGGPQGRGPELGGAQQSDAFRKFGDGVAAALGPERYADYLLAQRPEYRALVDLQKRFDVPQTAIDQVTRLQLDLAAANTRITGDTALDNAQKRAALTALADQATTTVRTALGPALSDTYLAATRTSWIDVLARGSSYSSQPTGGTSMRSFNDRPPPGVLPPKP